MAAVLHQHLPPRISLQVQNTVTSDDRPNDCSCLTFCGQREGKLREQRHVGCFQLSLRVSMEISRQVYETGLPCPVAAAEEGLQCTCHAARAQ